MSDLWSESVTGTVAVGQTCSLLYLCPGNKCVCGGGGGGVYWKWNHLVPVIFCLSFMFLGFVQKTFSEQLSLW